MRFLGLQQFIAAEEPPPVEESNSVIIHSTYAITSGGSEHYLTYLPKGYYNNPTKYYPTLFFYHGDGAIGTFATVAADIMTDAGGNLYTINGANTSVRRILYSSIIVSDDNGELARCERDMNGSTGHFYSTGAMVGITGTVALNSQNSAMSIQLPSAPTGQVKITYKHSALFETGLPGLLNRGKFDCDGIIVVMVQKTKYNSFFVLQDHWVDLNTEVGSLYRIDTNRKHVGGLSRGGFFTISLIQSTYFSQIASFMVVSAGGISLANWNTLSDKGLMYISGQNDPYSPAHSNILNTCGNLSLHNYPSAILVEGWGHHLTVWDTNAWDATTALFDWRLWCRVWNLNYNDQATQFVEVAEETEDMDRWREAKRAVYFMTTGATKTALETRLAALKSTIDNGKKNWLIKLGTTAEVDNYLNLNYITGNFTAGAVFSNLKDDNNNTTSVGLAVVNQLALTPANRYLATVRGSNAQFGFSKQNYADGVNLETAISNGRFKITGLTAGKTYKLRVYAANGGSSIAALMRLSLTIGGVTKSAFLTYNNRTVIEFTGITPVSNEIVIDATAANGNTALAMQVLQLTEE
jgi:hypothetical protein